MSDGGRLNALVNILTGGGPGEGGLEQGNNGLGVQQGTPKVTQTQNDNDCVELGTDVSQDNTNGNNGTIINNSNTNNNNTAPLGAKMTNLPPALAQRLIELGVNDLDFIQTELDDQLAVSRGGGSNAEKAAEQHALRAQDLVVMGYVGEDNNKIQLVHSLAVFHAPGEEALNGKQVAFVGWHGPGVGPIPVLLKHIHTWKWIQVEGCTEGVEFAAHYDSGNSDEKLWDPKERKKSGLVPRFVRIPLTLLDWFLEKERTCGEFHKEIVRRVANETLPGGNATEVLQTWAILAGQCEKGDPKKSLLATGVNGFTSGSPKAHRWCGQRLSMTVGAAAPGVAQGAVPPNP